MPFMTRSVAAVCLVAASFAVIAGCQKDRRIEDHEAAAVLAGVETDAAQPAEQARVVLVNGYCPVGTEPVVAEVGTVSYKGHNVGFCCAGCKAMWESMPEADRDAFIAKAIEGTEPRVDG